MFQMKRIYLNISEQTTYHIISVLWFVDKQVYIIFNIIFDGHEGGLAHVWISWFDFEILVCLFNPLSRNAPYFFLLV
jgi:hypothetical protein